MKRDLLEHKSRLVGIGIAVILFLGMIHINNEAMKVDGPVFISEKKDLIPRIQICSYMCGDQLP